MKKSQAEVRARAIRKKEAERLASALNASPPNTLLPNTEGEEGKATKIHFGIMWLCTFTMAMFYAAAIVNNVLCIMGLL